MKKCRITVMKVIEHTDLMERYENPMLHACDLREGLCDSAWSSLSAFVMTLAHGGENLYEGWMKNPRSAMISCNDGFRPVSFYIEALKEDADPVPTQGITGNR